MSSLWSRTYVLHFFFFSPQISFLDMCYESVLIICPMHAYNQAANYIFLHSYNHWKLFSKFSQNLPPSTFYSVEDIPMKLSVINLLVWILSSISCLKSHVIIYIYVCVCVCVCVCIYMHISLSSQACNKNPNIVFTCNIFFSPPTCSILKTMSPQTCFCIVFHSQMQI